MSPSFSSFLQFLPSVPSFSSFLQFLPSVPSFRLPMDFLAMESKSLAAKLQTIFTAKGSSGECQCTHETIVSRFPSNKDYRSGCRVRIGYKESRRSPSPSAQSVDLGK
ncbi:hypothetical protein DENSPDRAFT_164373 [Dentipellis sp. KUC8613]|nr:hypothetical protein DENSPDRAFT_164373 [Dentipellis sp. KUC8613]